MNAAVENLRVKQCGMLLAYSSSRHPAVTPGQTRQALLQASAQTCPDALSVCTSVDGERSLSILCFLMLMHVDRFQGESATHIADPACLTDCKHLLEPRCLSGCSIDNHVTMVY